MKLEDFGPGWVEVTWFGYPGDWTPRAVGEMFVTLNGKRTTVKPTYENREFHIMYKRAMWVCPICRRGTYWGTMTMQDHFDKDHRE